MQKLENLSFCILLKYFRLEFIHLMVPKRQIHQSCFNFLCSLTFYHPLIMCYSQADQRVDIETTVKKTDKIPSGTVWQAGTTNLDTEHSRLGVFNNQVWGTLNTLLRPESSIVLPFMVQVRHFSISGHSINFWFGQILKCFNNT